METMPGFKIGKTIIIKRPNIMNTKEKLMQLLELCIEKGLDFEASKDTVSASRWIADDEWKLRERIWLTEFENMNILLLNGLIDKVKNYQP